MTLYIYIKIILVSVFMCIGHLEPLLQYQVSKRQGNFETAAEFNLSFKCAKRCQE